MVSIAVAEMIANPSSSSGWPYCLCNCLPHQSYRSLYPVSRRALPAKMSRTICSRSLPLTTFKSRSLSLNNVNKGLVRALAESQVSDNVVTDSFPQPYSVKIPVGDRHVSLIASLSLSLSLLLLQSLYVKCVLNIWAEMILN